MAGILAEIKKDTCAFNRLAAIADGKDVHLTADQAERIRKHINWLSKERDSFLSDGCFDD